MPFKPGESGNIEGRTVELAHRQKVGKEALIPLLPKSITVLESRLSSDDESISLKAAIEVLNRVLGTPPQQIQLTGEEGGAIRVISGAAMSADEWAKAYAAMASSVGSTAGTAESTS